MTKGKRPLVDERSFSLAEHFLQDRSHSDDDKWDLAKDIQQAAEHWFAHREWLAEARKRFRESRERLCADADTVDFMVMRYGQRNPSVSHSNHPTGEHIAYGGRTQV